MAQPKAPAFIAGLVQERTWRPQKPSSVPWRIFAACLTAVISAAHYTNYSALIPAMRTETHITSGQAGLFSTLLFLGLAIAYIPAGLLIDRYGARPVLLASALLFTIWGVLLPLSPNIAWMLLCRLFTGIGIGGVFIAGAGIAAGTGRYAPVGQGLYGGSTQIGSGIGLLITPIFLAWIGWRGAFLFWGLLGVAAIVVWLFVNDGAESRHTTRVSLGVGLRSPAVWTLGLSHLGTFGLGNAIAPWIALYLIRQYQLPLAQAATMGAVVLLTGMFFRPLGGMLIGRRIIGAIPLLRLGTIMGFLGVGLLTLPLHMPVLVFSGLTLIAIGATMPYTSVFNEAARLCDVSKGVAQGLVSIISIPTVLIGPPLIGFLLDRTASYSIAFSAILFFSLIAIAASILAASAVARETSMPAAQEIGSA